MLAPVSDASRRLRPSLTAAPLVDFRMLSGGKHPGLAMPCGGFEQETDFQNEDFCAIHACLVVWEETALWREVRRLQTLILPV